MKSKHLEQVDWLPCHSPQSSHTLISFSFVRSWSNFLLQIHQEVLAKSWTHSLWVLKVTNNKNTYHWVPFYLLTVVILWHGLSEKVKNTIYTAFSNGFAFRHSDLDISLTFRDIPTRWNFDDECKAFTDFFVYLARDSTASRSSRSSLRGWSAWSGWGMWLPSPLPRSCPPSTLLRIFSSRFCHFSGSNCDVDPPTMSDRGWSLPL